MQIFEFQSKQVWLDEILSKIFNVISYDSNLLIGLAGGETPKPVYEKLGLSILDESTWQKLNFVTIDERDVSESDSASNYGMIKKYLFKGNIIHFEEAIQDPLLRAKKMDNNLRTYKQGKFIFDLLIIGMGEDGHIASIFPGYNYTKMNNPKLLSTFTSIPYVEYPKRFTLTYSSLNSAKEAVLLINSPIKLKLLHEIIAGNMQLHDPVKYPIVDFLKHVPTTIFALN